MLIGFLYARLKNEPEVKEIAQEAYVKVLQLDNPNASNFLRGYLFKVAENLALDRLGSAKLERACMGPSSLDAISCEESAEHHAIAREELALLEQAVGELPPKCQEAFKRCKFDELSFAEVAHLMGISERMVRKHVTRADVCAPAPRGTLCIGGRERLRLL